MRTAKDILDEKRRDMVWTTGDKSVFDAVQLMVANVIGAILIKEGDRFIGIFSERDLLVHMADPDFNPKTTSVSEIMSTPLRCVAHDTPLLKLKETFLGLFIRHLMVEEDGRQVGLLSIGDVLRASLLDQDRQIRELNAIAGWDYYEDWGWDRKSRR